MKRKNSRAKGSVGERELAAELRGIGLTARRTQQYSGWNPEASDVVVEELSELFVEVKRVERLNVWDAVSKAVEQAGTKVAAVFHRRNRSPWLVTVRLEDWQRVSRMLSGVQPSEGESLRDTT